MSDGRRQRWLGLVPALLLAWAALAPDTLGSDRAEPEARGREIAEQADRRDSGFGDSVAEIRMLLVSEDGRTRERRLTWKMLENPDPADGDKSLTIFHEPRDVAGTAFLTHTHIGEEDDQWLYLPALKRVKRIASVNKTGSFMGSEFAYEDLLSDEVEKFDHRWLRNEPCGDEDCYVVERRPRDDDSGYSREIVWFDQSRYRPRKIEYYDRRGRLLKTLTLDDYRLYGDRFWRAHEYRMANHQTGRETILSFGDYELGAGLEEQDFAPSALRRVR